MLRLNDPAFLANPTPYLASLRAQGPVAEVRLPILGRLKVTTSDAAARKLLKSHEIFRRDPEPITGKPLAQRFWWLPRYMRPLLSNMVVMDDPAHQRLRQRVETAFARTMIEDLRPAITDMAHRLLDDLPRDHPVDIIAPYTRRLPFLAICALLGIPQSAHARLMARLSPISLISNPLSAAYAVLRLRGVLREFRDLIVQARDDAGANIGAGAGADAGLIHHLANTTDPAREAPLNETELMSLLLLLFIAGHETTVHLINVTLVAMARDDALRAHWHSHPEARFLMVEESLRHHSPVMLTKPMFAARDTELLGAPVARGEMIAALLIAANHDPARIEMPEKFDPMRRPNAHLGFGFGPHTCLGMQLARIETEIAVTCLFERFPDLRLAEDPAYLRRPGLRAPAAVRLIL